MLLLVSVAQAKIEVRGDEAFKDQTNEALDEIKRTIPDGELLVRALEASKHIHVIRRTTAVVDSITPHSLTDATNGVGTASTIRWNPHLKKRYADGVDRDPTAALFHELCHALEADHGVWGGSLDPGTGIRKSEIQAIRTENLYRRTKGLPERTKYGQQDLPQIGAENLAETSSNERHSDGLLLVCKDGADPCKSDLCGSCVDTRPDRIWCEAGDPLNAP